MFIQTLLRVEWYREEEIILYKTMFMFQKLTQDVASYRIKKILIKTYYPRRLYVRVLPA